MDFTRIPIHQHKLAIRFILRREVIVYVASPYKYRLY